MADRPLLELRSVSKYFCRDARLGQRYGLADLARALVPMRSKRTGPRPGEFASIDNLSLSVGRGEALAIMGPNGAGKTTLLRLIAGLIAPDMGDVVVNGRVNAVIELGQGLNPHLTGRENAELGLACHGIGKAQGQHLVPLIMAFAELEDAFDSPVGTYSTGMHMRLAFAIAIHVPCDLLLLDEVLAVGDLRFQRKCLGFLQRHLADGRALIFVSHNPFQMQTVCRRGVLLDKGKTAFDGPIETCIDQLFSLMRPEFAEHSVRRPPSKGEPSITRFEILTDAAHSAVVTGDDLTLEIGLSLPSACRLVVAASIWSPDLSLCVAGMAYEEDQFFEAGEHLLHCRVDSLPLAKGNYALRCALLDPETMALVDGVGYDNAPLELRVVDSVSRRSILGQHAGMILRIESKWTDLSSPTWEPLGVSLALDRMG